MIYDLVRKTVFLKLVHEDLTHRASNNILPCTWVISSWRRLISNMQDIRQELPRTLPFVL